MVVVFADQQFPIAEPQAITEELIFHVREKLLLEILQLEIALGGNKKMEDFAIQPVKTSFSELGQFASHLHLMVGLAAG